MVLAGSEETLNKLSEPLINVQSPSNSYAQSDKGKDDQAFPAVADHDERDDQPAESTGYFSPVLAEENPKIDFLPLL